MSLEYGIVANVVKDRALRDGAKVWICLWSGEADRPIVRGLSIGGRTITKRVGFKNLTNFRAAWIPPTRREDVAMVWTKDEADRMAQALAERWERQA